MPILDTYHDMRGRRVQLAISLQPDGSLMITRTLGHDDEHATQLLECVRIEARARDQLSSWLALNPPATKASKG